MKRILRVIVFCLIFCGFFLSLQNYVFAKNKVPFSKAKVSISKASLYTHEDIKIKWTKSRYATKYSVKVYKSPLEVVANRDGKNYYSNQTVAFQAVKGLSANMGKLPVGDYSIIVTPFSSLGVGPDSNIVNFKVIQDDPVFPVDVNLGNWFGSTYPGHEAGVGAFQYSAVDINLANDSDKGKKVYAIQEGKIIENVKGRLVIEHITPLRLTNGTMISKWYSLYGHMTKQIKGKTVKKKEAIGVIASVGANNNHLHFSIFARAYGGGKENAISPYCLPGVYSNGKVVYADDANPQTPDNEGGESGLYKNRIYSKCP